MEAINDGIAIIGIACKFPGAKNKSEYWDNLLSGKETIRHFSDEELRDKEYNFEALRKNPGYVKARGVLDEVDKWDAGFFNVIPRDAKEMDPQQRIWLEATWEAFEDAGCDPYNFKGTAGVFAGSFFNTYLLNNVLRDPESYEHYFRGRTPEMFQAYLNSDPMFLATRTAYFYNLKGPAINVQTACSTSLVAVSQACSSLMSFETDLCIAGGVTVVTPQETGYLYQEGAIGSPDGHCRPFDKLSNGAVFGNGVGVVVLKRLQDAVNDKDNIYAVIRGWATNNDGNEKIGFTAPSIEGQSNVITSAHSFANIKASDISYIEAHGTGTPLGDPIEVAALTKAFRKTSNLKQYCGLGSVKSNIGHLDAAAGIAGLIKIALSAYYRTLPATINFTAPNPRLNLESSPFYIQDKIRKFDQNDTVVMGVSSFGIGGTNAHVVLSTAPEAGNPNFRQNKFHPELIVISAKTETALQKQKEQILKYIQQNPGQPLTNVSYTLQSGRNHMNFRSCFAISSEDGLIAGKPEFYESKLDQNVNSIAFTFPGQGAQYIGMGKQLYESAPIFKSNLDKCFQIFEEETGENLKAIVFSEEDTAVAETKLAQTKYTQPALFSIEYSLAQMYLSYGIDPKIMIGHSIGEYAAACIAGVFDLASAIKIVTKRGALMQTMPTGKMMAVSCSRGKLEELNQDSFEIAADNAQDSCTISFPEENLDTIKKLLEQHEISFSILNTSHAFHSKSFEPILEQFANYVNLFNLNAPKIPFISCLTGHSISRDEACSGEYWAKQLRNTVCFREGISFIIKKEKAIFLEVGPNTHLSSIVRRNKDLSNKKLTIGSLGKPAIEKHEHTRFIQSLGELWSNGYPLRFEKIRDNKDEIPIKISLPTYPWEKKRYWVDYIPTQTGPGTNNWAQPKEIIAEDAPQTSSGMVDTLRKLLSDQSGFPIEDLDISKNFTDLGFDSLFLAQFARNLEKKFKVKVAFRQLVQDTENISKLSEFLEQHSPSYRSQINIHAEKTYKTNHTRNLVVLQSSGSKEPLVLIHGDNANNFFPKHFEDRPIYSFLHIGADGGKNPFKDAKSMAESYLSQLFEIQPEGPYNLCGFSFGGLLAYEMSTMLQKQGKQVNKLIIIDTLNPLERKYKPTPKTFIEYLKINYYRPLKAEFRFNFQTLKYNLYYWSGTPIPVELRSKSIVHNYFILTKKHKPIKFDGDILLFMATENAPKHVNNLGWDHMVRNLDLIKLKGGHRDLLDIEENIDPLVTSIKNFLEK